MTTTNHIILRPTSSFLPHIQLHITIPYSSCFHLTKNVLFQFYSSFILFIQPCITKNIYQYSLHHISTSFISPHLKFHFILHFPIQPVFISHITSKTCISISINHNHHPLTQKVNENSKTGHRVRCSRRACFTDTKWLTENSFNLEQESYQHRVYYHTYIAKHIQQWMT